MSKVSEEYKKLYHYTTLEGLLGILQTQTLWATSYKFLNDDLELYLIKNKFINSIFPIAKEEYRSLIKQQKNAQTIIDRMGGLDVAAREYAAEFVDGAYKATGEDVYIVSFCGEDKNSYVNNNGLLSQWRGYGAGGGIALVFDTKKLEEIIEKEARAYSYNVLIADVVYSDDEKKFQTELSLNLTDFAEYFRECIHNMKLKKPKAPDGRKAYPAFTGCIGRYKHQGFKEENEVRIVCFPIINNKENLRLAKTGGSTLKLKERRFRANNGKLIPYIEIFDSTDIALPIERIIVGPHKDKDSRASTLRMMLQDTSIEITVSDIPYVD